MIFEVLPLLLGLCAPGAGHCEISNPSCRRASGAEKVTCDGTSHKRALRAICNSRGRKSYTPVTARAAPRWRELEQEMPNDALITPRRQPCAERRAARERASPPTTQHTRPRTEPPARAWRAGEALAAARSRRAVARAQPRAFSSMARLLRRSCGATPLASLPSTPAVSTRGGGPSPAKWWPLRPRRLVSRSSYPDQGLPRAMQARGSSPCGGTSQRRRCQTSSRMRCSHEGGV